MSTLIVHPQTLRALQIELTSVVADVQAEHRKVTNAHRRVVSNISAAILVRAAKVDQCRIALDACLASERESCAMEAAALAEAERRLAAAHRSRTIATQAVGDYGSRAGASLKRLELTQSQGLRYIAAKLDKVTAVNAGGASSAGSIVSSLGGDATRSVASGSPSIHTAPGMPAGYAMVPVSLIDQTEDPINGPQDFGKGYSIEDLDYAFDLFESQVLPALAGGADASTFQALDRSNGVYGTRSLSDTFSGFLRGNSAIKLERRPDGSFGITNGRHRVYVASAYGRAYVPALITGGAP